MTAFGVGFTPPIQGKTRTDLRLRAHPVDLLLPRAVASVAPLHRMRRGRQPCSVEKRQRGLQGRGKALRERLAQRCTPLETPPPLGQGVEGCLRPTAPITQRLDLFHRARVACATAADHG